MRPRNIAFVSNENTFPDLLVAPVVDENTSRVVYLPEGEWIDYWTGEAVHGGKVIIATAPLDVLPLYARAGSVIPKIPEDVMTLVPEKESGNTSVKSMDDRRIYELLPPAASYGQVALTDFEGRRLLHSAGSLTIEGKPARITIRWLFGHPRSVSINGVKQDVKSGLNGPYIEFAHTGHTSIEWK